MNRGINPMRCLPKTVACAWVSALLALSVFGEWTAFAQGKVAREPAAILTFETVGASPAEVSALTDRLQDLLLRTNKFQLVDRARIDAVLKEQAFQQTGCTSTECAVQAGKVLGVRKLITGKITKLDETHWAITASLIDVESAETLRAPSMPYEGRFFDFLQNGASTLANRLTGEAEPAVSPPLPTPAPAVTPGPSVSAPPPPPPPPPPVEHTGPKKGLGIALGSGSTSGILTFPDGSTSTYTFSGVSAGLDYQWAPSQNLSLGMYLRVHAGSSVGGDVGAASIYDQGSSAGLGLELRAWIGQVFLGGLVGAAETTLTDTAGVTPALTMSGPELGVVAGYEWLSGWHILLSSIATSLSGSLTAANGSTVSLTATESRTFAMVGYRF